MDWLIKRQPAIERKLAKSHLEQGAIAFYDVSSSYLTGSRCELAARGYSRDHRSDRPQIVYGLLCNHAGCPIAVDAFPGNTDDPTTLATQVDKLRKRFKLSHVVLVGDRGMITQARIHEDPKPLGLDWVTALRHSTIRKLAASKIIQPGLFDSHGIASVTTPDLPAERLLVCFNPLVAAERKRKRNALLDSTETAARVMADAYAAGKFDRDELNRRLGTLRRHKMGKHFCWQFDESTLAFCSTRNEQSIQAEASLDGIYVIRTSLASETLADQDVVRTNKSLARVERAFRSLKTTRLKLRPVFHWRQNRVQASMLVKVRCGPFPNYSGLGDRARHPALLDDRGRHLHPPRRSGEGRAAGRTVSGWVRGIEDELGRPTATIPQRPGRKVGREARIDQKPRLGDDSHSLYCIPEGLES